MTIQQAFFNIIVAEISVEFKPNAFKDERAVELEGRSILNPSKIPFTLKVFADSKLCVTANFVRGRSILVAH